MAAERVAAGRHLCTDVMVGAVAGSAFGIVVPWLHERRDRGGPALSIVPTDGGAMLAWSGKLWQVPSEGACSRVGPCMRRVFTGS